MSDDSEQIRKIMEAYKVTEADAKRILENRKREIEISIDTTKIENVVERLKESEKDAKGFRDIAKRLAKSLQDSGLDVDASEINPDNYIDYIEKLNVEREFNKIRSSAEEEVAKKEAEPCGKGGSGQALLSQASGVSSKEWESHKAMISDLRKMSHSEDPQIKAEAKAILSELFKKSALGMKEQESMKTVFEDKSKIPLTEQLNRKLREKALKKRKKEEED